jgi:hypothetical protein
LLPHQSKNAKLKPADVLDLPWMKTRIKKVEISEADKAEAERKRKERFAKWDAEMAAKNTPK